MEQSPVRAASARLKAKVPQAPQWLRMTLSVGLAGANPSKVVSIDRTGRTLRVSVCLPSGVALALAAAAAASHPWAKPILDFVRQLVRI